MKSKFSTNKFGFGWDNKVVAWKWLSEMRVSQVGNGNFRLTIYLGVQDGDNQAYYLVSYPDEDTALKEMDWLFTRAGEHLA